MTDLETEIRRQVRHAHYRATLESTAITLGLVGLFVLIWVLV